MKRILILFALLAAATRFSAQNTNKGEINFFKGNWSEALAKAKKEGKPIFLDAYASWCGPCKMMKNITFQDEKVAEFYNENFINVKIDMEHGEGTALSEKYHIVSYPSLLFFKQNGDLIFKTVGYHKPDEFIKVGKEATRKKT